MAVDRVIRGDYKGGIVYGGGLLSKIKTPYILQKHPFFARDLESYKVPITSDTVKKWEMMDGKENKELLHSRLTGTSYENDFGTTLIKIEFKDGKKCLLECTKGTTNKIKKELAMLDF